MLTLLFYLCLFRFCRVQGKYGILLCQLHVHYMHMHTHTHSCTHKMYRVQARGTIKQNYTMSNVDTESEHTR